MVCQITIAVLMTIGLFANIQEGIEGKDAKKPAGFGGAMKAVIHSAIVISLFYGAGSFSLLIR